MSEESKPEQGQEKYIRCYHCNTITKHQNIYQHRTDNINDGYDPQEPDSTSFEYIERVYFINWKCLGCENVTFEDKKFIEYPDGIYESPSKFYPGYNPNQKNIRLFKKLPSEIVSIYRESVLCYNTGAYRASAVCLRSLLEGILNDRGFDDNKRFPNLKTKIDGFASEGSIPSDIAKLLDTFRTMGNNAIHKLMTIDPSVIEIKYAIEAIEIMIDYMYETQHELKTKMRILQKMHDAESGESG